MNQRPEIELPVEDGMYVISINDGTWARLCQMFTSNRTDGLVFDPEETLNAWCQISDPAGPVLDLENGIVRVPVKWIDPEAED